MSILSPDLPGAQRCSRCEEVKPLADFPRNKRRKNGRKTWCSECMRAYHREHYRAHRPAIAEQSRAWYQANRTAILAKHAAERALRRPEVEARKAERKARGEQRREQDRIAFKAAMTLQGRYRRAHGLCVRCGDLAEPGHPRCAPCQIVRRAQEAQSRARKRANGNCRDCGAPALEGLAHASWGRCERCYLRQTAYRRLGSSTLWAALREKLNAQNFTCPYTGERIVLGVNDSVDHILPVSRYPELKHDVVNIEWVTRTVNSMKHNRTRDEFLAFIRNIADTCPA